MPAKLDLNAIEQYPFSENQYYKKDTAKSQIVIHHTVSGSNARNIFIGWEQNPERVATALVIGGDGKIVQGFSSKYWAHHLGTKAANNTDLNTHSIAIELCCWGGLNMKDGKYLNAYGNIINTSAVIKYPKAFRGFSYFHKYTGAQLESLRQLLVYLCDKYQISKAYNEDMWDLSKNALSGKNGIFTHVSYRADKSDCHPQPELIAMLKTLAG